MGRNGAGFGVGVQMAMDSDRGGLGMGLSEVGLGSTWGCVLCAWGLGVGVEQGWGCGPDREKLSKEWGWAGLK